jgi:non-ribosomal peptide synthetase component F
LFTLLVSALTGLLWQYTEREDIMIGTPVAVGRERSEFQMLLGYFLNPVALRVSATNHPSFSEISLRVQQSIRGALAHNDVPFHYVAESLALDPDRLWDSAFAVSISLAPPLPTLQGGWSMMPMEFASGGSQWNLYLEFSESQTGMIGRTQYNPDVFKLSTILAFIEDFQSVLEHGIANPELRLSALTNRRSQAALRGLT